MTVDKLILDFEKLSAEWIKGLEKYDEKEFSEKPSGYEWSAGQLYNHLVFANRDYFLKKIQHCIENKEARGGQPKSWQAFVILFFNNLPPRRYRVPKSLNHAPMQPQDKKEIEENFFDIIKRTKLLSLKIKKSMPDIKTSHPSIGYLNGKEWLQFMIIHMKHHLRQKKRIDDFLKIGQ
jgi:hypothetical protein